MTAQEQQASTAAVGTVRTSFAGLSGVRALGALFVLTTHVGFHSGAALNSSFNGLLSRLDIGVAIFFVISGFLLFRPHMSGWLTSTPRPRAGTYFKHRALRILPALWVAVVAAAALLPQQSATLVAFVRHATLVQIYTTGNAAQGLTQLWSLATEVAFYVLLPVIAWCFTRPAPTVESVRRALIVLLATPLVGAVWMWSSAAEGGGQRALWLPGYIGWFGLGMALALWHSARSVGVFRATWMDELHRYPGTVWALAGGLYLVAVSPVAGPYSLAQASPGQAAVKNLLYAAIGVLVVLPTVVAARVSDDPPAVRRLGGRTGTFFGNISYGIFCYHLIVLGLIESAIGFTIFSGGFWKLLVPTIVLTTAVATLSYYFVERPIMRWGRRNEGSSSRRGSRGSTPSEARHVASAASTNS